MRSVPPQDVTAVARIRGAAMELFATEGFKSTTVRAIAERADVSPALVVHHYGSKNGLRSACDEYLLAYFKQAKTEAMTSARMPDVRTYLADHPEFLALYGYLLRVLREGGPAAEDLFDRMCHDVEGYLALGETAGTIRPYADGQARAVISTAMAFGLVLFEGEIARRLGGRALTDPPVLARYADFILDLYTHGLLNTPAPRDDAGADNGGTP